MAIRDHLGSGFAGGVVKQTNPDRPSGSRAERRCPNGCGFYPKRLGACPACGDEPRFNKRLRTAILDGHLNQMAAEAERNR